MPADPLAKILDEDRIGFVDEHGLRDRLVKKREKEMTTRLTNGLPGIICTTCNGCGQERYKASELPPQFNVDGGRYEGDIFIRKCIKCDGLGAIADARPMQNTPPNIELRGMQAATPLESLVGGALFRMGW